MKEKKVSIYADGAARGNPGPAGAGAVLKVDGESIRDLYEYIGTATNNIAEYNALILGLREALKLGFEKVDIYVDSELLARQIKGEFRVKSPGIKPLFARASELINTFREVRVTRIDRQNNKEADKLANKAINLSGLNKRIG